MREIVAICIFFMTLILDVYTDYELWKKNKPVNHQRGAAIRLIGLVPVLFLLRWYSIPMIGFAYWLLFDGFYNKVRGFDWWFTGSDDPDDALLDNLLQKISLNEQIVLKIGGLILGVSIYITILLW